MVSHDPRHARSLDCMREWGRKMDLQGDVGNGDVDGVEEGKPEENEIFPCAEFAEVEVASP